jgi:hypothetical protein
VDNNLVQIKEAVQDVGEALPWRYPEWALGHVITKGRCALPIVPLDLWLVFHCPADMPLVMLIDLSCHL